MNEHFTNSIQVVKNEELAQIMSNKMRKEQIFYVELDGNEIETGNDYLSHIETKFKFPTSCINNWDGYLDWIRDLSWLEKEEYILVINHFSKFLCRDVILKNEIISQFEDTILPFWQEEVERVVVEGKAKPFLVYLVD